MPSTHREKPRILIVPLGNTDSGASGRLGDFASSLVRWFDVSVGAEYPGVNSIVAYVHQRPRLRTLHQVLEMKKKGAKIVYDVDEDPAGGDHLIVKAMCDASTVMTTDTPERKRRWAELTMTRIEILPNTTTDRAEFMRNIIASCFVGRADIINFYLSGMPKPRRYLEVGVRDPRDNFDLINAEIKHGVDPDPSVSCTHPMTSDGFFDTRPAPYDLIFIDGLHLYEQAYRDLANALKYSHDDSVIIVHDCNPPTEIHQREVKQGDDVWNGTVWKAFVRLRYERRDLEMFVIDTDWGVGIVQRGQGVSGHFSEDMLDYKNLGKHRKEYLGLITIRDWIRLFE